MLFICNGDDVTMKNIPSVSLISRMTEGMKYLFIAFLAIVFIVEFTLSLEWRVKGNSVYLHYLAYLINEHGFVPYRDLFEINLPGTYLFHIVIGKIFGYSDLVLRAVNVAWLAATFVVTWFIMKSFGRITALASCLLFGLIYLGFGPYMSLERDVIAILPIAVAVLLATWRKPNHSLNRIHFLHGVLFALAALVKPHLAIGFPAIIVYNCINDMNDSKSIKNIIKLCITGCFFALFGFLLTIVIPFLWLWQIGALQSFWEISSSYTPLYAQIPGNIEFQGSFLEIMHILYKYTNFEGLGILLAASVFGVYLVLTQSNSASIKRPSVLLLLLSILYSIYVVLGGKLWYYHWVLYMYFASLGTAIVLFSPSPPVFANLHHLKVFPLVVFIVASMPILHLPHSVFTQIVNKPGISSEDEREDQITAYLKENLSPTDKVQALTWIGGAPEAMFDVKAIPATPYVVELQFYHHVSNPYIQHLRKDFMEKLAKEMPAFIIDVHSHRNMLGMDGPYKFPELKEFIVQHYYRDYIGKDFEIFRRIDETHLTYDFGDSIVFSQSGNAAPFLKEGWSHPETSLIWSIGKRSSLRLKTQLPSCDPQIELLLQPFYVKGKMSPQHIDVIINGILVGSTIMTQENKLEFVVPLDIWANKTPVTIEFLHPNFTSPKNIGVGKDPRELAFAFKNIVVKDCQIH